MDGVLGGDTLFINSQPWECDKATVPLSSHGELAEGCRSCRTVSRKVKQNSGVNS